MISIPKHMVAGSLVEPRLNSIESSLLPHLEQYFDISDFTITLMIKGARRHRLLEGKLELQYKLLSYIIDVIISPFTKSHYFIFEVHKCGLWIHAHGFLSMVHRSKVPRLKQIIYYTIENKPLHKGGTYKHRCLIEKIHSIHNWNVYIHKNQPLENFKKKFKLFSHPEYNALQKAVCQTQTQKSVTPEIQNGVSKTTTTTQLQTSSSNSKMCISQ